MNTLYFVEGIFIYKLVKMVVGFVFRYTSKSRRTSSLAPLLLALTPGFAAAATTVTRMAALPQQFGIGLQNQMNDLNWMLGSGVPWEYRYIYLTGGWQGWNPPGHGQIASQYAATSTNNSYIPIFTFYVNGGALASLADASYINQYLADWALLLRKAAGWANWNTVRVNNNQLTLSSDNTTVTSTNTTSADEMVVSGNFRSSGKYIFEFKIITNNSSHMQLGVAAPGSIYHANYLGADKSSAGIGNGGLLINDNIVSAVPALTLTSGDVVDIAIDLDGKLIWSRKNGGVWNRSSVNNPSTGIGGASVASLCAPCKFAPAASLYAGGDRVSTNFAKPPALSGFAAWNGGTTLAHPIVVQSEPDMWGFMQQQYGVDPTKVPVAVAASGYPSMSDLPNNAAGFAQALVRIRDRYAPNIILGYHASYWGANNGYQPVNYQNVDPTGAGNLVAGFYNNLHAAFDVLFTDTSDRDAAFKTNVCGWSTDQSWMTNAYFSQFQQYLAAVNRGTGLKIIMWQMPEGNTLYRSEDNTNFHYQDNTAQYFLQSGNRPNIVNYVSAGVIGALFGMGQQAPYSQCDATKSDTDVYDNAGDGVTNPAAINGNTLTATYPDDDGGFIRAATAAYYAAGPVRLNNSTYSPLNATLSPKSVSGTSDQSSLLIWSKHPAPPVHKGGPAHSRRSPKRRRSS